MNALDPDELIPTRNSLLSRLKDWDDQDSWREFFNAYWRLVYGVARKAGLTEQEAEEVVQETFITVSRRIPEFRYDPAVCSFKTWLMNLTRWRIVDQLRKRNHGAARHHASRPRDGAARTPTIERVPDPASLELDAWWDQEWERNLLETAAANVKRRVNPEHFQMFALCVFKEWPARKVARKLGVSITAVYLARHRVGAHVRKELKRLQQQERIEALTSDPAPLNVPPPNGKPSRRVARDG